MSQLGGSSTPTPATPNPTTSQTKSPPATDKPTPNPKPTATPTPQNGPQFGVRYNVYSEWNSGYVIGIDLLNKSGSPVNNWQISWPIAYGETFANYWNGIGQSQY
jgi:hypothetical protein